MGFLKTILGNSPEEDNQLLSFYEVGCNLVKTNVDPKYVHEWKPVKSLDFGHKAMSTLKGNRSKAKEQSQKIRSLLLGNPLYMQAAKLADVVYSSDALYCGVEDWCTCNDFPGIQFNDKVTGLVSRLFVRMNKGKKEYIYATAGTNPKCIEDWKNNLQQLYGGAPQYQQALDNAKTIAAAAKVENASLFFVGHSLGGGIATNNALHTGYKAIVFNPAGVSQFTTNRESKNRENIECFIATNDILNWFQDTSQYFDGMKLAIPSAIGKRYYIDHINKSYPLNSHSMTQMIADLETLLH